MAAPDQHELASKLALVTEQLRRADARILELEYQLSQESAYRQNLQRAEPDLRQLTGDSPAMKEVRQAVQQVARTDSTVLILGETGTGKELVARAVHQLSPRRERLLVKVNCAALTPSLMTSELFGHEAGAFTGAMKKRTGRFELAHRGTLFLDEIGELPLETQALLLRVLQERVIERVGGNESIPVDVRLIAATHQDLPTAVTAGKFRADLYYRLHVFPICVPPLRQRSVDLPSLAHYFITRFNRLLGKKVSGITPATLQRMQAYTWPGNVRELANVMERAMIVANDGQLTINPYWLGTVKFSLGASVPKPLVEAEREMIVSALEQTRGRIYGPLGAATLLGVKPTTLYGKMRKLGIKKAPDELGPRSSNEV